jgi:hypothetical protein
MSIIVTHNAGFFSCCSVKLNAIIHYINLNFKLPDSVDSSRQFSMYKKDHNDITFDFFKKDNHVPIQYPINYHRDYQFMNYSKLDYQHIIPIVKKYFSPSDKILTIVECIKTKYNIDYNNTIAVYYRGTDKYTETQLASFDIFYTKIKELNDLHVDKKILIQTDTSQFIDYIHTKKLKNIVIIKENSTSYTNKGIHNEKTRVENYHDMLILFSTFIVLSKCNYIICSSGNCSIWMMFYRENSKNVFQFLNDKWCT